MISANEHKYTIIVWLNLITFLSIILVSIWASLQKRKHDIIMILKDYIINQYPLETLKNSQDEINKQLTWENARLRETVTLNNLTIDKQRERIEQLEDRLALDEEYFSASQSLAKERKWRLLNSLNMEDINVFLEDFGI
ncbi:hypothetical protein AN643_01040 [Candidatus Epulonipiscioides saccharophilum]|nr:hypothetical protein AN643_01040 [Epulopiscium sp. SCG-B10WGA-EpuloB]